MSDHSNIEWCDASWNPATGCSHVSEGCRNCYAERDWKRLSTMSKTVYYEREFTDVQCHYDRLNQPLRWRKPRRIFVNSMSDLFHDDVPDDFITLVFAAMAQAYHHQFIVMTKRPMRASNWFCTGNRHLEMTRAFVNFKDYCEPVGPWPLPNVWLGVSVEDQPTADERIPILIKTPAAVKVLSVEPLLERVTVTMAVEQFHARDALLRLNKPPVDWVIVGGESGAAARPFQSDWARSIRDECKTAGVPFFMKQMSGRTKAERNAIPDDLMIREFPT